MRSNRSERLTPRSSEALPCEICRSLSSHMMTSSLTFVIKSASSNPSPNPSSGNIHSNRSTFDIVFLPYIFTRSVLVEGLSTLHCGADQLLPCPCEATREQLLHLVPIVLWQWRRQRCP